MGASERAVDGSFGGEFMGDGTAAHTVVATRMAMQAILPLRGMDQTSLRVDVVQWC
jgi:hypothetical protein